MDLRDKSVLVTGASSGIGEALARELSRKGAWVALAARRQDRLEKLASELRERGGRALAVECDVTRDGDLEKTVERIKAEFGKLDIAIANAGFGVAASFEELALEDFRRQFETNVYGVLRTAWATLEELKRNRGQLVIMGSIAGHISLAGNSPYSMSKFAVRALAESLHSELAEKGVAVTLISPGFVESEIRKVDNKGVLHAEAMDSVSRYLVMRADVAARKMVRAIEVRKKEEIITLHGKVAVWLHRHFPWILDLAKAGGLRSRSEPKPGETS